MKAWTALVTGVLLMWPAMAGDVDRTSDLLGKRFHSWSSVSGDQIHLSAINSSSCRLRFQTGTGVPREPNDRVVIERGGKVTIVRGPDDLKGCVNITSSDDALEYLRFFSSFSTVHLFTPMQLEVFPDREAGGLEKWDRESICMPDHIWDELKLGEPQVATESDAFVVRRVIARPQRSTHYHISVFKVEELVKKDGTVRLLKQEEVAIPGERDIRIGFPLFM